MGSRCRPCRGPTEAGARHGSGHGRVVTYGIPVDTGPMAMYYRKDVFKKYGISVPTTWDEYAKAAEKLHKADPEAHIVNLRAIPLSGLAWETGAKWFGTEGDAWHVGVNDDQSRQLAYYLQQLVDKKLVATDQGYSPAWWNGLQSGKVATAIGAVWLNPLIAQNAPKAKGKFAVASQAHRPSDQAHRSVPTIPLSCRLKASSQPLSGVRAASPGRSTR
ncbi:extracellular solute-binding protein [Streptomyces sp. NPDC005969]|uniref:extracellular solute-binding protein n=1 Tax=Streptomyces sp. NPDC005969 TaxID=3156722 RepID=UPI0033D803A7